MIRETPTNKEAYVYENFRIFLKWTLDLYNNNASLMNLGTVDTVYVNMPADNAFLYPMIIAEAEENKLKFMPLLDARNQEIITNNLDLFGGFYVKQYNKLNNFHASQLDNIKSRVSEKAAAKDGDSAVDKIKEVVKKVVETVKKIATYDLTGGGS